MNKEKYVCECCKQELNPGVMFISCDNCGREICPNCWEECGHCYAAICHECEELEFDAGGMLACKDCFIEEE